MKLCDNKLNFDSAKYLKVGISGINCGLCVFFAVTSFKRSIRSIIILIFFVAMFVYNSFDHCIANLFYFAFANKFNDIFMYAHFILVFTGNSIGPLFGALLLKNSDETKENALNHRSQELSNDV